MYSEIKISDMAGAAVVDIEGVIGVPEKMQFEKAGDKVATYARFTESLRAIAELDVAEVIVNIRSTGGDVNDALLIYEALSSLEAKVTTRCYGYVASAATVIAQAASQGCREIASTTLYLIHCSESAAEGNSASMSRTKELLDKTDARIASIYSARSGRAEEEFAALMGENGGRGRWLSAHEAVDAGLADKVVEPLKITNEAHDASVMAGLKALAVMSGITMAPGLEGADDINEGSADKPFIRKVVEKMKDFFAGLFEEFEDSGEDIPLRKIMPAGDTVPSGGGGLAPVDNAFTLRMRAAQAGAAPTRTLPREDPSIGEAKRNSNDAAYYEDAMSLRERAER